MTGHLGLDDLAALVGSEGVQSAGNHLAGCELCRGRLANLGIRSAQVSVALRPADGPGGAESDVVAMPADVMLRVTAALVAAKGAEPGLARPGEPRPDDTRPDDTRPDDTRPDESRAVTVRPPARHDELAASRERRNRRLRGWLTAAAAVLVVGGGFGAVSHYGGGQAAGTAGQSTGAGAAADASSGGALAAAPTVSARANPDAARGALHAASFTGDAKAFVAAQRKLKTTTPVPQALSRAGSDRCATAAKEEASSTAGYKAGGGNAAPAAVVGAVTVDGRPGVLYLVGVGPVNVAVALAGCSSTTPHVLASATL